MSNPRPDHMNLAISAAAWLVIKSMTQAPNGPKATARILSAAILPAFGIIWNLEIIRAATTDAINKLLLKFRNSPLLRLRYDKLANMFKTAFPNPYSVIP